MCPKRVATVVDSLEDAILPPTWLPRSHEAVWHSLPQHWQVFLKGGGGSVETVRTFWSLLPEDKRNAALERIRAILPR